MSAVTSTLQSFIPRTPRVLASNGETSSFSSALRRRASLNARSTFDHFSARKRPASFDSHFSSTEGLYLQRLVTAIAGLGSLDMVSGITAGNTAAAYFSLKESQQWTLNWHPALVDGAGEDNVVSLSQKILDEIHAYELSWAQHYATENGVSTDEIISADESSQHPPPAQPIPVSPSSAHTRSRTSLQGLQPHIIVVLDGDQYMFNKERLLKGRAGGVEAARCLAVAVAEAFDHRLDYRLSVYLFLNKRGLMRMLVGSEREVYDYDTLDDFFDGFQAPSFNYVIDAGPGKERVDTKVKDLFKASLRSPDTECVILGVCRDHGYIPTIEGEILFLDKIKLLVGDSVAEGYVRGLPLLPRLKISQLFEGRFAAKGQPSSQTTAEEIHTEQHIVVVNLNEEEESQMIKDGERGQRPFINAAGNGELYDGEMCHEGVVTVDPRDSKARPARGGSAMDIRKNVWIAENPQGTEGEFQAYCETKGKRLYRGWGHLPDVRER